jgi:two-component SAPR family response regulator
MVVDYFKYWMLAITSLVFSHNCFAEADPQAISESIILKQRVTIRSTASFPDDAASCPALIFGISRGELQLINLIVDCGTEDKHLFYLIAGGNVQRLIPDSRFRNDTSIEIEATLSASPDLFQLKFADTIISLEGLGLHRGDKFTVSVIEKAGQAPGNSDEHYPVVSSLSVTDSSTESMNYTEIFLLLMLVVADVIFFVIIHLSNKYLQRKIKEDQAASILIRNEKVSDTMQMKVSSVHLFGGFTIWNKSGEEITSGFSPLLRELFLLLVCRQPEEGITSSALREILWYDKNEESARNNRSVYFAKLRQLLDTIGEYSLSNRSGKWIIDFHDIHVDFLEYSKIIRQETIRENEITKLVSIVRKGALLPECNYSWLDDVKAKVADYTITILSDYSDQLDKKMHPELLNSIADALFTVDPLNDLALTFKCRYYNGMGKVFLSKQLFTNYTREYRNQYGEEYNKSYMEVISEEN